VVKNKPRHWAEGGRGIILWWESKKARRGNKRVLCGVSAEMKKKNTSGKRGEGRGWKKGGGVRDAGKWGGKGRRGIK